MGRLSQVTRGKIDRPIYMMVYGVDGVGKTKLGSLFPNPIFIGPEKGTDHFDVSRFPAVTSWFDLLEDTIDLLTGRHDFKTVVVDTLDWIAGIADADVAKNNGQETIEEIPFGRGQPLSLAMQKKFRLNLEALREKRGMHVLLLAHSEIENFTDPDKDQDTYQRYVVKMNKKAAAMWRESVDAVLFANYYTIKEKDKADKKIKYKDSKRRVFHTQRTPGFDAKNRYGMPAMIEYPEDFTFDDLMAYIKPESQTVPSELLDKALALHARVTDPEVSEKASAALVAAGTDIPKLKSIVSRLETILEEQG